MRRLHLMIVLLLSFLLPLQVAASALLAAPTCPAKMTMDKSASVTKAAAHCCDEANGSMNCQDMQSCFGCNISCQLFSVSTPTFTFSSDTSIHLSLQTPFVALFDPASVWRPPTNS